MTSYKLTYFNMRGRAELPRYIFAYAGIAFEDRRVEWRDWPSIKKTFPLGKLPVLEVNGLPLTQSLAIARFLAKEAGLVGNSRLAEAQADALVDTLNDFTLLIPWREDNPQIKETWADLYCHVCFTTFSVLRPGFADHHPALCGLTDRVEAIPNIAKWIQCRPTTEF
ncbi:hematopoietic prostaglandin D synthase-like isoform X4 [Oncorhynchus masou masou]|uniref:hematopoietic prostaglandin D synthase-like isoform X4 n=1 Tax=Oncorhynchus masou masou TaxID=90313 RepID=UPI0031832C64